MKKLKQMKVSLDYFIQTLPEFVEKCKINPFLIYSKDMIIYRGDITPSIMKEWCEIAEKATIPFKWGLLYDRHNDMYMNWKSRNGIIYVTAEYNKTGSKSIVELTWDIIELTPDVIITLRQDGE